MGPEDCGVLITDLKTFAGWNVFVKDLKDLKPGLFVKVAVAGTIDGFRGFLFGGPGGVAFVLVFCPVTLKFEVISTMAN